MRRTESGKEKETHTHMYDFWPSYFYGLAGSQVQWVSAMNHDPKFLFHWRRKSMNCSQDMSGNLIIYKHWKNHLVLLLLLLAFIVVGGAAQ